MTTKRRSKFRILGLLSVILLGIYIGTYFYTTMVYHGRFGDTHYRIRLFHSVWHMRIFSPRLAVEQRLRPAEPEFSGQVYSWGSVPPPDDAQK
jgi:hypothetical protein